MVATRYLAWAACVLLAVAVSGADLHLSDDEPLRLPPVGSYELRVLAPTLLELTLITTKPSHDPAQQQWEFTNEKGASLPAPRDFVVSCGDRSLGVSAVGFKRRVIFAPLKHRDLRIANYLYLKLAEPVPEEQLLEVKNPDQKLW